MYEIMRFEKWVSMVAVVNIGRAKYVVRYHDGVKKHNDGSPFFDIEIFSNKRKKERRVKELRQQGYQER